MHGTGRPLTLLAAAGRARGRRVEHGRRIASRCRARGAARRGQPSAAATSPSPAGFASGEAGAGSGPTRRRGRASSRSRPPVLPEPGDRRRRETSSPSPRRTSPPAGEPGSRADRSVATPCAGFAAGLAGTRPSSLVQGAGLRPHQRQAVARTGGRRRAAQAPGRPRPDQALAQARGQPGDALALRNVVGCSTRAHRRPHGRQAGAARPRVRAVRVGRRAGAPAADRRRRRALEALPRLARQRTPSTSSTASARPRRYARWTPLRISSGAGPRGTARARTAGSTPSRPACPRASDALYLAAVSSAQ